MVAMDCTSSAGLCLCLEYVSGNLFTGTDQDPINWKPNGWKAAWSCAFAGNHRSNPSVLRLAICDLCRTECSWNSRMVTAEIPSRINRAGAKLFRRIVRLGVIHL